MNILILSTDSFGGHGGIALYNRDFAEALAVHDLSDRIVMVPRLIRGQIQTPPENVDFIWRAARGPAAYVREITRLLPHRNRFDLVFCAHINLLPIARLFSTNIVLLIYGVEAWKPMRTSTPFLLGDIAAVISISEITLRRFQQWSGYDGVTYLLPNAIHLDWYGIQEPDTALAQRLGIQGKRVLLTLGRIERAERYKGFDEVLDVLPDLAAEVPDLVYVIAGSGGDIPRLKAKAESLGVGDRVVFTGMIDEAEKAALYGLADLYVMPSRGEGFGFVLVEALACGVPVIASRHDGGFEAIRQGALGRAVDPSNPAEIRMAILDALREPTRAIPEELSYFSFDNFTSRLHSIVDQLTWTGE